MSDTEKLREIDWRELERIRVALEAVQHNRTCSCYVRGGPCARCVVGYDMVDAVLARLTSGVTISAGTLTTREGDPEMPGPAKLNISEDVRS